jgi:hypothetical protein
MVSALRSEDIPNAIDVENGAGATGKLDKLKDQEYGAQDFFGVIDEMRIWRTDRHTSLACGEWRYAGNEQVRL